MYQEIDEDNFFEETLPMFFQKYSKINNKLTNKQSLDFLKDCKFLFGYLDYNFSQTTEEEIKEIPPEKKNQFNDLSKNLKIIIKELNLVDLDNTEDKYESLKQTFDNIEVNLQVIKLFFNELCESEREIGESFNKLNNTLEDGALKLQRNLYNSQFLNNLLENLETLSKDEVISKREEYILEMKKFKYLVNPNIIKKPNNPYLNIDIFDEKLALDKKEVNKKLFKYNTDNIIFTLNFIISN
jgi:hypothetical protein